MREEHLDDELVQRVLHDELTAEMVVPVTAHLSTCEACQFRVRESQREEALVFGQLRSLDHEMRMPTIPDVIGRGERRRGVPPWIARLAAGLVIATGLAGAAYAAPGSPVPQLLHRILRTVTRAESPPAAPDASVVSAERTQPIEGVAVDPGERLSIVFPGDTPGGTAIVSLVDGTEVLVRASAGAATFTSEVDRLIVEPHVVAPLIEIRIPRAARDVEIRVADRRIYRKVGTRATATVEADTSGAFRLPLVREPQTGAAR